MTVQVAAFDAINLGRTVLAYTETKIMKHSDMLEVATVLKEKECWFFLTHLQL